MGGKGSGRKPGCENRKGRNPNNPMHVIAQPGSDRSGAATVSYELWMRLQEYPDIMLGDADVVRERIMDFFRLCDELQMKPMVTLLAFMLGMNVQVMHEIMSGNRRHYHDVTLESMAEIEKAYDFLVVNLEKTISDEKGSPVKWFFLAKNHFGYRDEAVQVVRHEHDVKQLASPEDIAAKYARMLGAGAKAQLPEPVEAIYEVVDE